MAESADPKFTIKTEAGADLPEPIRELVESWLNEAEGDLARALVVAAEDAAIWRAAASRGLLRLGPDKATK
ncbi:MAG: hypothetical protein KGL46_10015 [Hyphomicrobiales bacterium]|nr:hypothetical protein [Hyphomicrobiales bacterium]